MPLSEVEENTAALQEAEIEVSAAGTITSINRYGAKMFGYARVSDLIGKPLTVLIPTEDRARQKKAFERALEEDDFKIYIRVVNMLLQNGERKSVLHRVGRRETPTGERYFISRIVSAEGIRL